MTADAPMPLARADPKGLIAESYRMEWIGAAECRSIFLDWALSLAPDTDAGAALRVLLATYGGEAGHPMTGLLTEGLAAPGAPAGRRRPGARRR